MSNDALSSRDDASEVEPVDASTVVLLRPGAHEPEALLLRRHPKSRFMAGAYVFPGGHVDAADAAFPLSVEDREWCTSQLPIDDSRAVAFFVAGIRELFEEAGVLLARPARNATNAPPEAAPPEAAPPEEGRVERLRAARARLNAGEISFSELLASEGLEVDVRALRTWSHWITPSAERRRYDTRFFVAWLPEGQEANFDAIETTKQVWAGLRSAVAGHFLMHIYLAPPTQRTFEELQAFAHRPDLEAELDAGRLSPPILPKLLFDQSGIRIVLPWDTQYSSAHGSGEAAEPLPRQAGLPSQIYVRRPNLQAEDGQDPAQKILQFWFGVDSDSVHASPDQNLRWWRGGPDVDEQCRSFEADRKRLVEGEFQNWGMEPQRDLARVLLIDQISRNIFRGTAEAFAHDGQALAWVKDGISAGRAAQLPPLLRSFYLMPLMHAEDLDDQNRSVSIFEDLARSVPASARAEYDKKVEAAHGHRDIIARFGRFPHRNAALGRTSTPEEQAFIDTPGSGY